MKKYTEWKLLGMYLLVLFVLVVSHTAFCQIKVIHFGEEVKRFQADISFKMVATREDVQEYIEELIISKF